MRGASAGRRPPGSLLRNSRPLPRHHRARGPFSMAVPRRCRVSPFARLRSRQARRSSANPLAAPSFAQARLTLARLQPSSRRLPGPRRPARSLAGTVALAFPYLQQRRSRCHAPALTASRQGPESSGPEHVVLVESAPARAVNHAFAPSSLPAHRYLLAYSALVLPGRPSHCPCLPPHLPPASLAANVFCFRLIPLRPAGASSSMRATQKLFASPYRLTSNRSSPWLPPATGCRRPGPTPQNARARMTRRLGTTARSLTSRKPRTVRRTAGRGNPGTRAAALIPS